MKSIIHGNMFRPLSLLAASALLALATGCIYVSHSSSSYSNSDIKAMTTRTLSGDIPAAMKSMEVENRFGAVHVVAVEGEPTQWSWKLTVGARTDALAGEIADAATCQATPIGDHLRLVVSLPNANGASFQSDLEIRVPKSISLSTRNAFGETRIAGVLGDVEATGQNGSVELRGIGGKVRAQTSFASLTLDGAATAWLKDQNGRIEATNIRGPLEAQTSFASLDARDIGGDVRLHDQNGRIEAVRVKGNADVHTSFAEMRVESIDGDVVLSDQNGRISAREISGSINASTSFAPIEIETASRNLICHDQNGAIRVRAYSGELASLDAQTSFAPIEVRLSSAIKPAINARTSFAEIESDFPVLMKPRSQDAFAEVDPATPRVNLQNQNGQIRILKERTAAER